MPTLRLITSPSQHHLLEALADTISASPLPPLEKESIVILSNGMARWLSIELAARLGVSAGLEFSFPNDLLDRCFSAVLPEASSTVPFTQNALTWRIASHLPTLAPQSGFEPIAAYLGSGRDDRRLMQISRSIAACFDQYVIFRPELVLAWDAGEGTDWQARLWRAISSGHEGKHRAARLKELKQHAKRNFLPLAGAMPRRISLFGISYLPPFHLEALRLLSSYCDVTCYLLNPCGEYWGSIISEKRRARLALRSPLPEEAQEYYETGNPLLSSLGTLGQEFFETILEYGFEAEEAAAGGTREPASLLSAIQNDILTLFDRPASGAQEAIPDSDRSVQIHSCHGPLREMEILYDNLLAQFDELPGLEPRHIVVMIPDIETYAPYISSVFGSRASGRPPLPVTITDRSLRRESRFTDAFLTIIGLSSSRFALHEMLDLLELPVIMNRFDLDEDDLIDIKEWLVGCNVRWGYDADHRAGLGFARFNEFSWQAGLDRLLLGYAMLPEDAATFDGILPYPACSGRRAEALGKTAEFITAIKECSTALNLLHTLPEWADILAAQSTRLLQPDESDPAGPLAVARALNSLREACTSHGFDHQISLDAVRDHLTETLTKSGGGYGFMGGAITFCAMLPMRSIPMRVVWLAGMNDGQFPRTERPPGFSLMNGTRRRGDRSLRDEDRYLFLEALMAAQDRFCISYTGQNDRDNSTMPPSVLVAELMDYVAKSFAGPDGEKPTSVLTRHRLQGFSPHYFDGHDPAHLFSYDRETCHALEARRLSGRSRRSFIHKPLPFDDSAPLQIDLHKLRRFLANPAAAFLEQRLGIKPFNPADEPEDSEPFSLDALSRYAVSQELVCQLLAGATYDDCLTAARSRGELPPLAAGKAAFDMVWERSRQFAAALEPQLGAPLEPLPVAFSHENIQLHALLDGCRSGTHVRWRCSGMKGKDRLAIWLDHLLLNIAKASGYPRDSIMISSDSILELPAIDHAADILTDLLDLYRDGMTRPLRFFPETSWALVKAGLTKAEAAWQGDQWRSLPGERDNQAVAFCFGDEEPWGEEFSRLAERVYGPLLAVVK
jgi:exodeoxyribonuclease V gamma subunit